MLERKRRRNKFVFHSPPLQQKELTSFLSLYFVCLFYLIHCIPDICFFIQLLAIAINNDVHADYRTSLSFHTNSLQVQRITGVQMQTSSRPYVMLRLPVSLKPHADPLSKQYEETTDAKKLEFTSKPGSGPSGMSVVMGVPVGGGAPNHYMEHKHSMQARLVA